MTLIFDIPTSVPAGVAGAPQEGAPNTRAQGSAATENYAPAPLTADEYGLAANRAERERAFDDQSDTERGSES